MRLLLIVLALATLSFPVHAELRIIGVKIEWSPNPKTGTYERGKGIHVSIFSDVKEENVRDVSVPEAAKILRSAKPWRSMIEVGVFSSVDIQDYLPIIQAISDNGYMVLELVTAEALGGSSDPAEKYWLSAGVTKH